MTDEEYEEAYREALLCIPGVAISAQYTAIDGRRLCDIDGIPRDDMQVFQLAWGNNIANRIRLEREGHRA